MQVLTPVATGKSRAKHLQVSAPLRKLEHVSLVNWLETGTLAHAASVMTKLLTAFVWEACAALDNNGVLVINIRPIHKKTDDRLSAP